MIMSSKIKYEHITRGVSFIIYILYEILCEVVHEYVANTIHWALWLEILEISRNVCAKEKIRLFNVHTFKSH